MNCPQCSQASQVKDSRNQGNEVWRIRICPAGHRWSTTEVVYKAKPQPRRTRDSPKLNSRMNTIARYAAGEINVNEAASMLKVTKGRVSQMMRVALAKLWRESQS